ncbi:response regulator [Synechococcus sp. BMK-MC-1]|nr:response regulator [Synechococcus sp. BMK-MC-1]
MPTCQLMIVLVRETQAVVQEAMEAFADGVVFKSSLGTGRGDLINVLRTLADGGVYFPEQIRRIAASTPQPDLPPLVEELTPRELEVTAGVARGLKNNAIATLLGLSVETVKSHVGNAMDKLGARDRPRWRSRPCYMASSIPCSEQRQLQRLKITMLRVGPCFGQLGITRHGVRTVSWSASIEKWRICSVPTHSGFQATSTAVIQRSSSSL